MTVSRIWDGYGNGDGMKDRMFCNTPSSVQSVGSRPIRSEPGKAVSRPTQSVLDESGEQSTDIT